MDNLVEHVINTNTHLLLSLDKEIEFQLDNEGKRVINQQTQKLYRGKLSREQIIDIILRTEIAIRKMALLKNCGWGIPELRERVSNSLEYYAAKFDVELSKLLRNDISGKTEYFKDLNEKFPPRFRANDGHYVRSKSELLIDNLLFSNNIVHAYEKKLPGQKIFYCDFYLPPCKDHEMSVYIEHWGFLKDGNYQKRRVEKLKVYNEFALNIIELFEEDIDDLCAVLGDKLNKFGIFIE